MHPVKNTLIGKVKQLKFLNVPTRESLVGLKFIWKKCLKIDAVVSQDRPTFRSVYKTITKLYAV